MAAVIGELLPLALGIAISPIPVIAAILMLLSPHARATSVTFLLGWLLGILVAVVVFSLLSGLLPQGDDAADHPVQGWITIVLGLGLLLLAVRQWRARPKDGEAAVLPAWMGAIDEMTAVRGLLLGFALAAINPKNLLMAIAAGVAVGDAALDVGAFIVVIAIFVVVAASTVALPVLAYLAAAERMRPALGSLREWLVANNATVMAILLLVLGAVTVGKGLGKF